MRLIPAAAKILAQLIQGKWVIYMVAPSSETPRRRHHLIRYHVRLLVRDHHNPVAWMHWQEAIMAATIVFCMPPETMTHPTWRRSQLERDDMSKAVAIK